MNGLQQTARFDTSSGRLIRRCLQICDYHDDLVEAAYPLSGRTLPLVTFAHRPHDARSSCIAFLHQSETPREDANALRELGAPLIFFVGDTSWEMWSLRADGSRRERGLKSFEVEAFFSARKADFAPGSVFRAKTWARAHEARQLDFVDVGLLPLVESEAGARLRQLFEDMVAHTMDALDLTSLTLADSDAHWLMKANFWLLAGKLLHDKNVPKFTNLDLHDVQDVFDRVAEHYSAPRVRTNGRLAAIRGAANVAAKFTSLRSISTETLGALYEEALLSEHTRKLLSVHRTPTYLVDYMLAKLSSWMVNDIGYEKCHVFEPACGHAPFLVGAVRMLSDMLPNEIGTDRSARRMFLRKHIAGCDRDSFALEIARLSLTLADIPNPNGWDLDPVVDMFGGDYLDNHIAKASVTLVNPPFENTATSAQQRHSGDLRHHRNGQAAEMLRRLLRSTAPGSIFGAVVPQSLLEGKSFMMLRRDLLERFELREITVFPDNVFQFADVETAIILGRRPIEKPSSPSFTFRRVREADMPRFVTAYLDSTSTTGDVRTIRRSSDACLVIPDLLGFWNFLKDKPRFTTIATIGNGFIFLSKENPDYPAGELTTSPRQAEGFVRGFAKISGSPDTHLLPVKTWLNQKPEIIACERSGIKQGLPQVLLNHVRVSRQPWRLKAFLDPVGCPATGAFLLVRPRSRHGWSLQMLWALCNSPIANAYTYTHSSKKHIMAGFLRQMPVPDCSVAELHNLEEKVHAYFTAAREFSAKENRFRTLRRQKPIAVDKTRSLFDDGEVSNPEAPPNAQDLLRALHWSVDAEVLRLYALPPVLEREILNLFEGVRRVGVPFEQTSYLPRDVGFDRLEDFLRITDDWETTDTRRCELIEKRLKSGRRSAAEEAEFRELQRLFDLHRKYYAAAPLFDESKLRELQDEDARLAVQSA